MIQKMMMMIWIGFNNMSYQIEQIKKSLTITDYLSEKGINPIRQSSEKALYQCPMPHHPGDNDPSFTVYEKDGHEDFYCYGCKSSGSIINLIAEYEQIGLRKAIRRLSNGLDIDIEDMLDAAVREARDTVIGNSTPPPDEVLNLSLYFSSLIHDFLVKVKKNDEDLVFCEELFGEIDRLVYAENVESLRDMSEVIDAKIKTRYRLWIDNKEKEVSDFSDLI